MMADETPITDKEKRRKELEQKEAEWTERLSNAKSLDEVNAIRKERADYRIQRLKGAGTKKEETPKEETTIPIVKSAIETRNKEVADFLKALQPDDIEVKKMIEVPKEAVRDKPIDRIVPSALPQTPEQAISDVRKDRIAEETIQSVIKEPIVVTQEERQPDKEYIWLPDRYA